MTENINFLEFYLPKNGKTKQENGRKIHNIIFNFPTLNVLLLEIQNYFCPSLPYLFVDPWPFLYFMILFYLQELLDKSSSYGVLNLINFNQIQQSYQIISEKLNLTAYKNEQFGKYDFNSDGNITFDEMEYTISVSNKYT